MATATVHRRVKRAAPTASARGFCKRPVRLIVSRRRPSNGAGAKRCIISCFLPSRQFEDVPHARVALYRVHVVETSDMVTLILNRDMLTKLMNKCQER